MKVRKIAVFSLIISVIWLSFSCNPALGSAWYRSAAPDEKPSIEGGDNEEIPQQPQDPGSYTEVKPFEYFNENYVYPASKFDEWVLYMTAISNANVASYRFEAVTAWQDNDSGEHLYVGQSGKGSIIGEGQINKAWDLKYYMYKTREDRWVKSNHFNPNLTTEEATKQKRFYFYRFTGKASAGTNLDNSTFCVDTYSKFLFFYSEPAAISTLGVPSGWQDYAAPSTGDHTQRAKKFYEYDPVGYVMEDGTVVIYNWFKAKIMGNDYSPVMNPKYKLPAKAGKAGEKGYPGYSPYKYETLKIYGTENEEEQAPTLRIAPVYLKNISMTGIFWTWKVIDWTPAPADPVFSYSYKAKLSYSDNGNTSIIEELVEYNKGKSTSKPGKCQAIKLGDEIPFTPKLLQKEIPNDAENIEAELILQIIKYNTKNTLGVYETTDEKYITKFEHPIKITYDKAAKKWLCPAVNKKEILPGVKMSYRAFELKRGKLKNFKILFESTSTNAEGDVEAAYMISWN